MEREKKKKDAKNANKTEEEKTQEEKKDEEEGEAATVNPKVKLSIEFSRSGYLLLTKATVAIKERTLFLNSKQARREAQLDEESLRTAKSRLKWYTKRDENKIKTDEAKNNFEAMIYTMRDWLRDDENAPYVEESASAAYIEQLTEWEDWLYDEGSNLMYNVYEDMFKNMTKDLNSYKARKSLSETRPEFVQKTNEALDKMKEVMEEDFESAATQEEKTDVIDKISEVKTWFNDLADQQSSMKKHEDPILNLDEVAKKVKNVKKLFDKVKNKKKPKEKKPKKEEKKEGEEEGDAADKKEEDASKEEDAINKDQEGKQEEESTKTEDL